MVAIAFVIWCITNYNLVIWYSSFGKGARFNQLEYVVGSKRVSVSVLKCLCVLLPVFVTFLICLFEMIGLYLCALGLFSAIVDSGELSLGHETAKHSVPVHIVSETTVMGARDLI